MRKKYKIIRERFEEMLSEHTDFFRDEKGNPIIGKVGVKGKEVPLKMNRKQDLACMLIMTPQALSNNISGKFSPSKETLERIGELYNINWKWLCDPNEYKSDDDWVDSIQKKKNVTADCMWGIIENSLNKSGKSLKFIHRAGQHVDATERIHADCYYSIVDKEGNEIKRLTAIEMIKFEQKIQEYSDFLTEKYL